MATAGKYELSRDDAVGIMQGLGFKTADSWNRVRMQKKIDSLLDTIEDNTVLEDPRLNNILDNVISHLNDGNKIELIAGKGEATEEEAIDPDSSRIPIVDPPKRRGRPPKVEETVEFEEEIEEEIEEEAVKPKRRGRPKKIEAETVEEEKPKRRGRPKKETVVETPKRRAVTKPEKQTSTRSGSMTVRIDAKIKELEEKLSKLMSLRESFNERELKDLFGN